MIPLEIRFCNLLSGKMPNAGFHIMGLNLLSNRDETSDAECPPPLSSDSSYVGRNQNSFAAQGRTKVYRYFAGAEGTYIISSAAQPNQSLEVGNGLFGCAVVEPPQAEYYRSQVTRSDLFFSTYRTDRLPADMLLHKKPGSSNEWILTTYKTRLQREAIKNVDVFIKSVGDKLLTKGLPIEKQDQTLYRLRRRCF